MRMFEYLEPLNLKETLEILSSEKGTETRILAGGTDLIVRLKRNQWKPKRVVNIKRLPELKGVSLTDTTLSIGALVTLSDVMRSKEIGEDFPVLARTCALMASPQIRNIATFGGNICNSSPAADLAPPLLCLDAEIVAVSRRGERTIPISSFFTGPGKNALNPDELLREIRIPRRYAFYSSTFQKLEGRKALDISIVAVAISAKREGYKLSDVRIGLGAVAPTPVRTASAEKILNGKAATKELIAEAATDAYRDATPIDDVRSTALYRKEMVRILVRRGLEEIAGL